MSVRDAILKLNIEEIEKMNLLSQLEHRISEREHWKVQKLFWVGIVILGVVAQVIAYLHVG